MSRINRDALHEAICNNIEALCQHYFPLGKRLGSQWAIGNANGDAGQSLRIQLDGDKAGVAFDHATSEKFDFLGLVKAKTGMRFLEAARDIGSVIGINVEESGTSRASGAGPRYRTSGSTKPCDWDHDYGMSTIDINDLISERGYSQEFCEWAVKERKIGRTKKGLWAFPVYDNGTIVSAHVRITKANWRYEPKLKDLGLTVSPLIVGDTDTADKVFVDESQWDVFAALDRLGAHLGERIAGIATRGASNAALIATIQVKADLYAIPQNDEAGKKWTESLGTVLAREFKVIMVPQNFNDVDDWLRALSDIGEFVEAIRNAKLHSPAKSKIYVEFFRPSYFVNYQPPQDLVLVGDNHIIRGTVIVLGGPPGVGKSRAIIASAIAGARRVPWFGMEVHHEFRTLVIQSENGMLRLKEELSAIDQTGLEDHLMICPPPPYGLCFAKDIFRDQLKRFRDELGPQLVWVDPWNAVAHSDQMRDYRETFDIICETLNLNSPDGPSIGIAAHTRKPMMGERVSGRALLNLLSGSYILGSVPRTVFIMQSASDRVDETRVVWTCCKNNNGPLGDRSAWERKNGLFVPAHAFDWKEFAGRTTDGGREDGRSKRKIESTIDDALALIPEIGIIWKEDLYKIAVGKVARDDLRDFIGQLLREQRLFIHKVPFPDRQRDLTAYSRFPPAKQNSAADDADTDIEDDLEDDPR